MTFSTPQNRPKPLYSLGFPNPKELHYICAVDNLSSILSNGIYSRKKVIEKGIKFVDPSNSEVQGKRGMKSPLNKSPDQDNLHHYVNLYFNAFNRTLSNFYDENPNICVLRIHPKILKRKGCILADRNAATNKAQFRNVGEVTFDGIASILFHVPKSKFLEGDLPMDLVRRANQLKQAELLVPSRIPSSYIKGIFVPDENVKASVLKDFNFPGKVTIHPSLFFAVNRDPFWLENISAPELSDTDVESYSDNSDSENNDGNNNKCPRLSNNLVKQYYPKTWKSGPLPYSKQASNPFSYHYSTASSSRPPFRQRRSFQSTYRTPSRFHPYGRSSSDYSDPTQEQLFQSQSFQSESFQSQSFQSQSFQPQSFQSQAPYQSPYSRNNGEQWRSQRSWVADFPQDPIFTQTPFFNFSQF